MRAIRTVLPQSVALGPHDRRCGLAFAIAARDYELKDSNDCLTDCDTRDAGRPVQSVAAAPITIAQCFTGDCDFITGSIVVDITADGADDVKIVINNLTNGFIDELGLLYTGGLAGNTGIEGAPAKPTLLLLFGACQNDNTGQGLNVCFDFGNKQADRFQAGQSVTFFLDSNTVAILAAGFNPAGAYAHVQGLPDGGSVKLVDGPPDEQKLRAVPEPGSLLLIGSGVAAAFAARRRTA